MDRGTTLLACRVDAPPALETAYDLYAIGLFDYCRWALGEDRNAADAVADALLTAAARDLVPAEAGAAPAAGPRLHTAPHQPVDGEPLRAWIFAVARNEWLLRSARATTGNARGGSRYSDLEYPIPQLTRDEREQLAQLQHALDELDPFEQELAELAFRHGFSPSALAAIVGRSLPRVRTAMAHVYAHLSATCPDGVAVVFAVAPFARPPASLRRLVLEGAAVPPRLRHLATRHAPYDRYGFPLPYGRPPRRTKRRVAVAGMIAVAVALGVAATDLRAPRAATTPQAHRPTAEAPKLPSADAAAATPATAVPSPSGVPSADPAPLVVRRRTPTHSIAPRLGPPPAPRRTLTTSIQFTYNLGSRTWGAVVTSTVRGVPAKSVQIRLWWEDVDGKHYRKPATTRTGQYTYSAEMHGLPHAPVACAKATVVTTSGEKLETPIAGPAGSKYCGSPSLGASPSPTPKAS